MPCQLRKRLRSSALWLALGLAQFGGLALTAHFYPGRYDWRKDVMSKLTEPRFNPHSYWIGSLSLALTGLLLLPFPSILAARLGAIAPRTTRWAGRFLYLGAALLILAAAIPGHVASLGRAHEDFAQAFGGAISIAMILYFIAAQWLPRRLIVQRFAGLGLIVIPFSAFAMTRILLIRAAPHLSGAEFHTLKQKGLYSLSLWEWIAAAGTYLLIGVLTFGLQPKEK